MLEAYLEILEEGYYEVKFAFEGLADNHVWKRPAEGILSVGELAGHVAYWEAVKFAGESNEEISLAGEAASSTSGPANCQVSSLLIDRRFRYLPTSIATPPSGEQLAMPSEQVYSELLRVHNESIALFKALNPDLDSSPPGFPPYYTYRALVRYAAIHISYHTGQMFTVRHLLGEQTPDN